jgi:hypothetical protein
MLSVNVAVEKRVQRKDDNRLRNGADLGPVYPVISPAGVGLVVFQRQRIVNPYNFIR